MRAMSLVLLLIVLACIGLTVRSQLQASKRFLPSAAAASSAPFGGASSPTVSEYQRELDKAMKAGMQRTADQAASAGEDATR